MNNHSTSLATHWTRYYRPKTLAGLHLESVKKTLEQLMSSPAFPQVLLFAGPKGTGKTTAARIISAMLNDPGNEDLVKSRLLEQTKKTKDSTLKNPDYSLPQIENIIAGRSSLVKELDAASNRGIDDIRQLREEASMPPMAGLITVFILDEVHMLTTEAFNALLKILEEPPKHAVFILATTELHKIPATIISRAQVVNFHQASDKELRMALENVIQAEKLTINDENIEKIIQLAEGSFRDAVKLLQLHHAIPNQSLEEILQLPEEQLCLSIIDAVITKDSAKLLDQFNQARSRAIGDTQLLHSLTTLLHEELSNNYSSNSKNCKVSAPICVYLLTQLTDPDLVKPSPIPLLRLELKLLGVIEKAQQKKSTNEPTAHKNPSTISSEKMVKKVAIKNENSRKNDDSQSKSKDDSNSVAEKLISLTNDEELVGENYKDEDISVDTLIADNPLDSPLSASTINTEKNNSAHHVENLGDGQKLLEEWGKVVEKTSSHNYSLAALLKSAKPIQAGPGFIKLAVYYSFHKDQLMQPKWLSLLQQVIVEIAEGFVEVMCIIETPQEAELVESTHSPSLERLAVEALL